MTFDMAAPVVAGFPDKDGCFDPPQLQAPAGTTYLWANTTVVGQPDLDRLGKLLRDGWSFVLPTEQPSATSEPLGATILRNGFCLMEKPTELVAEQRARERAPHMDMDIRVISIMERYTGEAQPVELAGVTLGITVKHRLKDGTMAAPLETPADVQAELLKRGFAPADVRLFMQRHFGKEAP